MPPEKVALIQAWLRKAQKDLLTAKHVLTADPPLTDSSVFHCQQAVEKALKAFLLWMDKPFGKTHNLRELSQSVIEKVPRLEPLLHSAAELTPYAVVYRYPEDTGVVEEPTLTETKKAISLADKVLKEIIASLPKETWPKKNKS